MGSGDRRAILVSMSRSVQSLHASVARSAPAVESIRALVGELRSPRALEPSCVLSHESSVEQALERSRLRALEPSSATKRGARGLS